MLVILNSSPLNSRSLFRATSLEYWNLIVLIEVSGRNGVVALATGNAALLLQFGVSHVKYVAENDSLVDFKVGVFISLSQLGIILSQESAVTFLGVDPVELGSKRASVHHALVLLHVFGVGSDVDDHRVVLWQTSLKVRLLPLVLLLLRLQRRMGLKDWAVLLFVGSSREPKELKMQVFDIIKISV